MTQDEFEEGYAQRSGTTVDHLHGLGLFSIPCTCGEEGCEGWQMSSPNREPLPWRTEEHKAWQREVDLR